MQTATCMLWHASCDMWITRHDIWHVTYDMYHAPCSMCHTTCNMQHVVCDMQQVACSMWHATCDMWHMTCDMWHKMQNVIYACIYRYIWSSFPFTAMCLSELPQFKHLLRFILLKKTKLISGRVLTSDRAHSWLPTFLSAGKPGRLHPVPRITLSH